MIALIRLKSPILHTQLVNKKIKNIQKRPFHTNKNHKSHIYGIVLIKDSQILNLNLKSPILLS